MADTGAHTVVEGIEIKVPHEQAVGAAHKIAHAFEHLHHIAEGVKEKMHEVFKETLIMGAGAVGLGLGFERIGEKVLEANNSLDKVQKSLASTLLAMESWNKGIPIADRVGIAMWEGKEAAEALEKTEMRLAVPIEDLNEAFKQLSFVGFKRLGRSQEEVIEMTNRAAAAAKAMGISSQQAGLLIESAIMRRAVRGFGPLQDALRTALTGAKRLSDEQVWARIDKSLAQFTPAADRMATGFGATMTRINLFFERSLRDVGAPLFKEISNLLGDWQKKIDGARATGEDLVQEVGQKLVTAFRALEVSTKFLYNHWRLIAGVWASWKALGIGTRLFAGARAGGVSGALGAVTGQSVGVMTVNAGVVNLNGGVGAAAGAAEKAAEGGFFRNMFRGLGQKAMFLGKTGLVGGAGAAGLALGTAGTGAYRHLFTAEGRAETWAQSMKGAATDLKDSAGFLVKEVKDKLGMATEMASKAINEAAGATAEAEPELKFEGTVHPKVKPTNIQNFYGGIQITQDFKDMDPDRVMVAFKSSLENLADNPQQSGQGSPYAY